MIELVNVENLPISPLDPRCPPPWKKWQKVTSVKILKVLCFCVCTFDCLCCLIFKIELVVGQLISSILSGSTKNLFYLFNSHTNLKYAIHVLSSEHFLPFLPIFFTYFSRINEEYTWLPTVHFQTYYESLSVYLGCRLSQHVCIIIHFLSSIAIHNTSGTLYIISLTWTLDKEM